MSSTKVELLRAACAAAGGARPLADRLGVSEPILRKYMAGSFPLPDFLLLRAVDVLLEEREGQLPAMSRPPMGRRARDRRDGT